MRTMGLSSLYMGWFYLLEQKKNDRVDIHRGLCLLISDYLANVDQDGKDPVVVVNVDRESDKVS